MSKKIDKIVVRALKNVIEEQEKNENLKKERNSNIFSFFVGIISILIGSGILGFAAMSMMSPEPIVSNASFIMPDRVSTIGLSVFSGVSIVILGLILTIFANGELTNKEKRFQ